MCMFTLTHTQTYLIYTDKHTHTQTYHKHSRAHTHRHNACTLTNTHTIYTYLMHTAESVLPYERV